MLDKTTTEAAGPITGNSSDPLGIGADVYNTIAGYFFAGQIDEVRLWNVVRSPAEIQAGMFQVFPAPLPANLLAYWRLNDVTDETGDHDGSFTFHTGEANAYDFRIKFVQGNTESAYVYTTESVVITNLWYLYLPVVIQ